MAVNPSKPRGRPRKPNAAAALSASEALKAAEAAIGAPAAKPAPTKAPARKPVAPKPALEAEAAPVTVVAASTAVDAAPEPPAPETLVEEQAAPVATAADTPQPDSFIAQADLSLPSIEGTTVMTDILETGKKYAEDAKAKLETVYAGLNEKAKASVEKSTKALEEMSDIAKGNVEALVESGKIAAKGLETMGQDAVDYSKKSFEKATATVKSFSTAKTPTEFFQLHSAFLSSTFDELTKETAKNSEALIKLAGDIASPLTARVTLVTDKVKQMAA